MDTITRGPWTASELLRSNVCSRNRWAEWRDEQKCIYGIPFNRTSWAYRRCTVQIHRRRAYSVAESVLRCSVYWPNRLGQCQNVGTKDGENVYAPLVMVAIWGWKRTHAKRVYQNETIDTSFDLPLCSLASTLYVLLYFLAKQPLLWKIFSGIPHHKSSFCFIYV